MYTYVGYTIPNRYILGDLHPLAGKSVFKKCMTYCSGLLIVCFAMPVEIPVFSINQAYTRRRTGM